MTNERWESLLASRRIADEKAGERLLSDFAFALGTFP